MNKDYSISVQNSAAMVQEALKSEPRADGLKEFFEIQAETDKLRNEDLLDAIPELEDVMEWTEENS